MRKTSNKSPFVLPHKGGENLGRRGRRKRTFGSYNLFREKGFLCEFLRI